MPSTLALLTGLGGPDLIILIGLASFIFSIIAIVEVLKSRADPIIKLLWVLILWFIPWIGLILYYTIGRQQIKTR